MFGSKKGMTKSEWKNFTNPIKNPKVFSYLFAEGCEFEDQRKNFNKRAKALGGLHIENKTYFLISGLCLVASVINFAIGAGVDLGLGRPGNSMDYWIGGFNACCAVVCFSHSKIKSTNGKQEAKKELIAKAIKYAPN